MAGLAWCKRRASGPSREFDCANQIKSAEPPPHSECVESSRDRQNGAAALPFALPVLRAGGRAQLPALSTKRRSISRRSVQYRVVLTVYDDGGAGGRSYAGRFCSYVRRSASLQKPSRTGARTTFAGLPIFAADETKSGGKKHSRFQVPRLRTRWLRPAPVDQSDYRGIEKTAEA